MARRRWGGARISENPHAPDAAQRTKNSERRKVVTARVNDIDKETADMMDQYRGLVKAAREAMEVGQLRWPSFEGALERCERYEALRAERKELVHERTYKLSCHTKRWRVGLVLNGPIPMFEVICEADTLDELAALIPTARR